MTKNETPKRTHGGRRPGAGRPTLFASRLRQITVYLPAQAIEYVRALGKGNLSHGIRKLVELHREGNDE